MLAGPPKKAATGGGTDRSKRTRVEPQEGNERFEDLMEGEKLAEDADSSHSTPSSPETIKHRTDSTLMTAGSRDGVDSGGLPSTMDSSNSSSSARQSGNMPHTGTSSMASQSSSAASLQAMLPRLRRSSPAPSRSAADESSQQQRPADAFASSSSPSPGSTGTGSNSESPSDLSHQQRASAKSWVLTPEDLVRPTLSHGATKADINMPPRRSAARPGQAIRQEMPRSYSIETFGRRHAQVAAYDSDQPDMTVQQQSSDSQSDLGDQPEQAAQHRARSTGSSGRLSQLRLASNRGDAASQGSQAAVKVMQSQHTKEALEHLPDIDLVKGWEQQGEAGSAKLADDALCTAIIDCYRQLPLRV